MRRFVIGATIGVFALGGVTQAAVAADDSVSFTVTAAGAGLSLSAAGTTSTIDSGGSDPVFDALSSGTVTGNLNAVTVTDARGTLLGSWTVTVSGTSWINGSDATVTVAASNGRAYLDAADLTALTTALGGSLTGMTLTSAELTAGTSNLGTPYTLVAGTTALGNGEVTYTPAISVTVPANTPAGTYTATVTQTVS
jgi:hypothetical protein